MDPSLVVAIASAIASALSVLIAGLAIRSTRRDADASVHVTVSMHLEADAMRAIRRRVYQLDRDDYLNWDEPTREAVDSWIGYLDLVGTLIQSGQLQLWATFMHYGDVIIRTVYQTAPYCNHAAQSRGQQFQLPMRLLTQDVHRIWSRLAKRGHYPAVVGFPAQSQVRLSVEAFLEDPEVKRFLWKGPKTPLQLP